MCSFDPSEGEGWGRILQSQKVYLHVKHPVGRIPQVTESEVDPALPLFDGVLHRTKSDARAQDQGKHVIPFFLVIILHFFHFKYFYICLFIPKDSHSLEAENCLKLRVITIT